MIDDVAPYAERALEVILQRLRSFAANHELAANRVALFDERGRDPSLDALLHALATLFGRLDKKRDDDYPQFVDGVLGRLWASLMRPVPSAALVEVTPDFGQVVAPQGIRIPAGRHLFVANQDGVQLQFRSTADLTLWPVVPGQVHVERAGEEAARAGAVEELCVPLSAQGNLDFAAIPIDALRFQVGIGTGGHRLYEALTSATVSHRIVVHGETPRSIDLGTDALVPCGFTASEALLPGTRQTFEAHRLLVELFAFEAKFLFFESRGWQRLRAGLDARATAVELRIGLSRPLPMTAGELDVSIRRVPIVNLFPAAAVLRIDPLVGEQRVDPEVDRPGPVEVHSIERVRGCAATGATTTRQYLPFFGLRHDAAASCGYWHPIYRDVRWPGTARATRETYLALVDEAGLEAVTDDKFLFVETLASNADHPIERGVWGSEHDFNVHGVRGLAGVRCVQNPTSVKRMQLGRGAAWRLQSLLTTGALSLIENDAEALRELLRVLAFACDDGEPDPARRLGRVGGRQQSRLLPGRGFASGTRVTVRLAPRASGDSSWALFGTVLDRVLGLHTSPQTFCELEFEAANGSLLERWLPRAGGRPLL